jgi:hypothetical protein
LQGAGEKITGLFIVKDLNLPNFLRLIPGLKLGMQISSRKIKKKALHWLLIGIKPEAFIGLVLIENLMDSLLGI